MYKFDLFLGFPIDPLYQTELAKANPKIVDAFMQGGGEYLKQVSFGNVHFLGKQLGDMVSLAELELVEKNIYSLLKKLVSEFPYDETALYLFPIEKS